MDNTFDWDAEAARIVAEFGDTWRALADSDNYTAPANEATLDGNVYSIGDN